MAVRVVIVAEEWPVTLAEAKHHLRIDHDDDDPWIEMNIQSTTLYAENFTGRSFTTRVLDYSFDEFPASNGVIELPKPPLIEVLGVFSQPGNVAFDDFEIDYGGENMPARLFINSGSWPTTSQGIAAGRIRYRAGYVDPNAMLAQVPHSDETLLDDDTGYALASFESQAWVPQPIKSAILMYLGTLYHYREEVQDDQRHAMPWGAELLLRQYRVEKSLA